MFAYGILKVIYAPHKAFKEIIKNPRFIGPLLIMVLFILASIGREYARASKIYGQQTLPSTLDPYNPDPWTENCTMWASNANIAYNSYDGILGYNSIQFNITDDINIWMELNNIGQIDCSSPESYKNLTFGIKWIHPTADRPQNSSLYLFSMGATDNFYRDLAEFIGQTENDTWSNFTIPLGPNAEQWLNSSAQATWNNITGLKLELVWAESARSNLTILLDRMFFQSENFESITNFISGNIVTFIVNALFGFSFYWMLFGLMLFIAARVSRIRAELKIFLIIVGYALIAMVIMEVLFIIFYLSLSPLYFSLDVITPTSALQTMLLFGFYTTLLLPIWAIILSCIGVTTAFNLPLSKSAVIAFIGFLPYYILLFLV